MPVLCSTPRKDFFVGRLFADIPTPVYGLAHPTYIYPQVYSILSTTLDPVYIARYILILCLTKTTSQSRGTWLTQIRSYRLVVRSHAPTMTSPTDILRSASNHDAPSPYQDGEVCARQGSSHGPLCSPLARLVEGGQSQIRSRTIIQRGLRYPRQT